MRHVFAVIFLQRHCMHVHTSVTSWCPNKKNQIIVAECYNFIDQRLVNTVFFIKDVQSSANAKKNFGIGKTVISVCFI